MKGQIESRSYMELALHSEGEEAVYLRVPTFWDDVAKTWRAAIKTPVTRKIINAFGKDSFELENSFNTEISKAFESEIADEVFSLFRPKEHWEKG